ncbi:MAG TPA: ferritin-like domain-containing protein [Polyangiaceae bacterium]|nr:ferritin-like domain-containing protein [Polyangiaceae bacterium]
MAQRSLRGLFSAILLGDVAVLSALGVAGCGGGIDTSGFDAFSCEPPLEGLSAAIGADSVELWSGYSAERLNLVDSDGVPCASARDQAACLASLEQARARPPEGPLASGSGGRTPFNEHILITRGDELRTVSDRAGVDALLFPVDSPEKVRLWARYELRGGSCEYVRRTGGGVELVATVVTGDCPWTEQRQRIRVGPNGEKQVVETEDAEESNTCAGRRPAGLVALGAGADDELVRYLEEQAYLEAASVEAFERLAGELASLGAPRSLVRRARRAKADEVRHHALLVEVGRRYDARFLAPAPRVAPAGRRSLLAFALENAIEGCVRETWGALVAHHQARRASDPALRQACAIIADDETRHAELSWAIHAWAQRRLGEAERRELERAMARAADELAAGCGAAALGEGARAALGLPSAGRAQVLLARLHAALWPGERSAA